MTSVGLRELKKKKKRLLRGLFASLQQQHHRVNQSPSLHSKRRRRRRRRKTKDVDKLLRKERKNLPFLGTGVDDRIFVPSGEQLSPSVVVLCAPNVNVQRKKKKKKKDPRD